MIAAKSKSSMTGQCVGSSGSGLGLGFLARMMLWSLQARRSRRDGRLIEIIGHAKAAHPGHRRHALRDVDEAAIYGAAEVAAILRAPRIVLRFGTDADPDRAGKKSQHDKRKLHGRLPVWRMGRNWPRLINAGAH